MLTPRLDFISPDVINLIVNDLEASLTQAQAHQEGQRLSLVSRDLRDAGPRLVFRSVTLKSLDIYAAPMRRLMQREYRLASFIRQLKVTHLAEEDPTSHTEIRQFLSSLTQVNKLHLETKRRIMSRMGDLLHKIPIGQKLEEISLEYDSSLNLFDFDERDFAKSPRQGQFHNVPPRLAHVSPPSDIRRYSEGLAGTLDFATKRRASVAVQDQPDLSSTPLPLPRFAVTSVVCFKAARPRMGPAPDDIDVGKISPAQKSSPAASLKDILLLWHEVIP
ncbi:hypothetical protein JCM11641_001397 [Rhodosporidiobolus odoratus]